MEPFLKKFFQSTFQKAFMHFISVMDEMGAVDEPTVKQFHIKIKKDGIFSRPFCILSQ